MTGSHYSNSSRVHLSQFVHGQQVSTLSRHLEPLQRQFEISPAAGDAVCGELVEREGGGKTKRLRGRVEKCDDYDINDSTWWRACTGRRNVPAWRPCWSRRTPARCPSLDRCREGRSGQDRVDRPSCPERVFEFSSACIWWSCDIVPKGNLLYNII